MKEAKLEDNPLFNKNLSGLPQLKVLDTSIVNDTLIPLVGEPIIETVTYNIIGTQYFTFDHKLGRIYEPLIRMRPDGFDHWYTLPIYSFPAGDGPGDRVYIYNITNTQITIAFDAVNFAMIYEGQLAPGDSRVWHLEIYFLNIPFEPESNS